MLMLSVFARRSTGCLWTLLVIATLGCNAQSGDPIADYPRKTVTVVCPWSAGGGTDRLARFWADHLQEQFGKPFIVVNKTGGSGAIGHTDVSRAKPDGYTIGMITVELNTMHQMGLCDITHEDFDCLIQMNADAAAILVREDAPWKNADELLDYVKQNPGKLKMSGTATGGIWDLARAGWLKAAGLPVNSVIWVPSQGSAPSLVNLLGGHVDAVCCSLPEAAAQLEGKQLRGLAVMAEERLPQFPDVPTLKEQGLDWVAVGWRGLAVPKGTPPEIVNRLHEACVKIAESDEFRDFMRTSGFAIEIRGPEEFREFLAAQDKQWEDVVQAAGYGQP